MQKTLLSCAVLIFSFLTTACGGGPNIPDGDAKLPTYTEAEQNQDYEKLADSENRLDKLGLKFKTDEAASQGATQVQLKLEASSVENDETDRTFANLEKKELTEKRIEELKSYIQAARTFLKKYTGNYNLQRPGQRRKIHNLPFETLQEIEAKVRLCEQTLEENESEDPSNSGS